MPVTVSSYKTDTGKQITPRTRHTARRLSRLQYWPNFSKECFSDADAVRERRFPRRVLTRATLTREAIFRRPEGSHETLSDEFLP